MKIAVPVLGGRLSPHFGHCDTFSLIDVDDSTKALIATEQIEAPPMNRASFLAGWESVG